MMHSTRIAIGCLAATLTAACDEAEGGETENGTTCEDPADKIEFADPALEAEVLLAHGLLSGDVCACHLKWFYAGDTGVTDLTGLESCPLLRRLELWGNDITDLSPLSELTNLDYLDLGGLEDGVEPGSLVDLSPLSGLTNLEALGLARNSITDLRPLIANPGLGDDDVVDASENPLDEESCCTHRYTLINRGVVLSTASACDPYPGCG